MARLSGWLWVALAGAVLQFVALGSNFYIYEEEGRDAWFGIPHTSELILASALVTVLLAGLVAAGRSPMRGRSGGLFIGIMGTLAAAQLGYRMVAPPFAFELADSEMMRLTGSCLVYCAPSEAADATLLPGIWIGLIGCLAVAIGGYLHGLTRRAATIEATFWLSRRQEGMNPWLGLAGIGAVAMFVLPYTFFTFYVTPANGGTRQWSGWIPTPHTSVLVLWVTVLVVGLVVAAGRRRSPVSPAALGGMIAILGFVGGSRILYRIIEPPFGGGTQPADIGIAAFLGLAAAVLVIVAGAVQAATHREPLEEGSRAGPEPTPGRA